MNQRDVTVKSLAPNQYLICSENSNLESINLSEKECDPNEVMSVINNLTDKKIISTDYEPIFRDLQHHDKLLQTCEKDEDDSFILSEFQLDQLEPLSLSPDTITLTNDLLPSSSSQPSPSNIRQISDFTTDLTNVHNKSDDCLQVEICDSLDQLENSITDKNNCLKEDSSCALVYDVSHHKQIEEKEEDDDSQRIKCTRIKENKFATFRRKRNKLSLNGDRLTINSNIDNNNLTNDHNNSKDNRMMTVVAISTNKISNMTQIVINTGKEEQIYQGKTTELLEATSNLPTLSSIDSSINWSNTMDCNSSSSSCSSSNTFNRGQDLFISKALEELGITDDALQPSNVTDHGKIWHCPREDCTRKFNRLYALKCHLLTHYGVRPFKCDFDGCAWSFFSEFKLKRHKETHLKKKDYVCKIAGCERQFTTIYNLWSHEKLHSRPSKIVCHVPECEEKFQTKRALELHMKSHDQSHAPYVCKHMGCDKRYYSNNALTSHQRCHSYKETDIKCSWPGCNKVFDKPCRLKAHVRSHTGCKPYTCNYQDCQWAFSSSSKLKRHQKKHTNDRKFVCDITSCGKAFMRSEHLKEHKLTHNEGRYFRCDLCDSKFSAKSSLYVHIKKHHRKDTSVSLFESDNKDLPQQKTNISTAALKSLNPNTSLLEYKSADSNSDYVFYADKMIMLTTPSEAVIFNTLSKFEELNDVNTTDNVSTNLEEPSLLENEAATKCDQGSARTRLTRSDVSKLKGTTSLNAAETIVLENNIEADDILNTTDITESLLFTEELSSLYYRDDLDGTECQVLLLDPNTNAESVINLKDFN